MILGILVVYEISFLSFWKFLFIIDVSLLSAQAHSTVHDNETKILIAFLLSAVSASVYSHQALSFYFFSESPELHTFVC